MKEICKECSYYTKEPTDKFYKCYGTSECPATNKEGEDKMLLKDFEHHVYYCTTGHFKLVIEAEVVIKRDGKHYAVPYKKETTMKEDEYDHDLLSTFISQFIFEAKKIDEKWIVSKENREFLDYRGCRITMEKEIEL